MPLNCVKRAPILPLLSSYSCLLEAVSERLEIDANSRFMVTYNSDNDIVEVCDDLKANEFMEFVVESSRIVTLCIVECSVNDRQSSTTRSNQQSNFIHATPSANVYQTEYHATQIHQTKMRVFPGSSGLIYQNLPSYQQMHGFSENHVYVPGFLGLASKDESSESDDESSESDEEGSESDEDDETTPVENKNCKVDKFWSMPPLLKTPVLDIKKKKVMSESSRIYRRKKIMTDMKARFKIDISYSQAWRAKCYALKLLRGTPEESFAELTLYCHNLKVKNPGTITHIETDDQDRFENFFLAVGDAIRIFVSHIRPLIIIDGAHLKGESLGTMYLAVAMDGNNQILPLAYGVGKSETFRSWDWFLRKLKECIIGKQDNLTIISDGAVSIGSAINNVFPNAFHGRCCHHLLMNLREK
nr:hypothetical protein [Tanacetum cinerariifolium]